MIAYLAGKILKKTGKDIILETNNIGYLIHVPINLLNESEEFAEINLFIHHHIREDANELFGFKTYDELGFFKQLIQINGIGPKSGLEIINTDINKVKNAIINEDSTWLCKIPGIGQKTAKRIILELKNKIDVESLPTDGKNLIAEKEIHNDAIDALTRLGYQRHHITKALKSMPEEIIEAEEIVTYFLRNT